MDLRVQPDATAAPAAVWERWTKPQCWAEQDAGMAWARIRGPLAVGSKIELKPSHGPKSTVTISRLRRLFGEAMAAGLPAMLANIARLAELAGYPPHADRLVEQ